MSCAMCDAVEAAESMQGRVPLRWIVEGLSSAVIGECRALGLDAVVASLCPDHAKEHERAHAATCEARQTAAVSSS